MKKIENIDGDDLEFEVLFSKVVLKEHEFVNKDIIGDAIMARIETSRRRSLRYMWAAASAIIILLTTSTYALSNQEFASKKNSLSVLLPDGSHVQMQKNSHLSYNRISWLWSRTINFEGTAHFAVAKGQKFVVKTDFGDVEVLGTNFLVATGSQSLEVECFSGLVGVKTTVGDKILHPKEKVECSPKGIVFIPAEEPLPAYLEFDGVPLTNVVDKIEKLFDVTIAPKNICQDIKYDGLLPTGNLEEALEIVMSSCGIEYTNKGNQIILRHAE